MKFSLKNFLKNETALFILVLVLFIVIIVLFGYYLSIVHKNNTDNNNSLEEYLDDEENIDMMEYNELLTENIEENIETIIEERISQEQVKQQVNQEKVIPEEQVFLEQQVRQEIIQEAVRQEILEEQVRQEAVVEAVRQEAVVEPVRLEVIRQEAVVEAVRQEQFRQNMETIDNVDTYNEIEFDYVSNTLLNSDKLLFEEELLPSEIYSQYKNDGYINQENDNKIIDNRCVNTLSEDFSKVQGIDNVDSYYFLDNNMI